MIQKKKIQKPVQVVQNVDVEVFQTSDGRYFETHEEAVFHENVDRLKKELIQSALINNEYLTQYTGKVQMVYFQNEQEVEAYEQMMCGNLDGNTWNGWLGCREKFQFPCWVLCQYVYHENSGDYTARYMTKEEVIQDLAKAIEHIKSIS